MDNNNMYNQDQQQFQQQTEQQQFQQQPYQQQPYQQAPYQQTSYQDPTNELEEPVTFGEWMITMLVMIPCVNIVMMFVWAFGNGKKSKSNYFKAALVWALIGIVISILFTVIFGATFAGIMNSAAYY